MVLIAEHVNASLIASYWMPFKCIPFVITQGRPHTAPVSRFHLGSNMWTDGFKRDFVAIAVLYFFNQRLSADASHILTGMRSRVTTAMTEARVSTCAFVIGVSFLHLMSLPKAKRAPNQPNRRSATLLRKKSQFSRR